MSQRVIFCVDIKAFYASIECADRGLNPFTTPLVVCDKKRGSGTIILSVTPFLKKQGIPSRLRLYELPPCDDIIFAKPRMERYLRISTKVIEIFLDYVASDDIHIYSIDESFLDFTHYLNYYGQSVEEIAKSIIISLKEKLGLYASIGISNSLFTSKVSLDIEAKTSASSIAYWKEKDIKIKLASISPLSKMWGIGSHLEKKLNALGFYKIGDIQNSSATYLKKKFGVIGEELYNHANGIDTSDIREKYQPIQRSLSIGQVLMEDYYYNDILIVIREMSDDLVLKMMIANEMGQVFHLSVAYSRTVGGGFSRQIKLDSPTFDQDIIFETFKKLFEKYYNSSPIRKLSLSIGGLVPLTHYQLDLFHSPRELERKYALQKVIFEIKNRYGPSSILRLKDLTNASTARIRHQKLGGHNRK